MKTTYFVIFQVKAVNYPRIERNWNDVMEESSYYKYSYNNDEYIDSTNSSLTIMEKHIECKTGEDVIASIPVVYVVKDKPSADINIQVCYGYFLFKLITLQYSLIGGRFLVLY